MKLIHINGNTFQGAELTFNNICRMEEMDAPITLGAKVSFSLLRAYLALCMNTSKENAGEELEKHILNGGSFDEISEAMAEAIEQSDFFRSLQETAAAETPEVEKSAKNQK